MFTGEYNYVLDTKGRLSFPQKFREQLGECFVVTRWLDDCLVAFSNTEWERISNILMEKSVVKSRDIQRFLYAGATDAQPDKQGRILLPNNLRAHAGITRDVTVIGVGTHAEIWDTDRWNNMTQRLSSSEIAKAMEELDF